MSANLPVQGNDRETIARQIDRAYIATVLNSTELERYLIDPRGPLMPVYLDFYECFATLYTLTSPYSDIIDKGSSESLADKIAEWLSPENTDITASQALEGLRLFRDWQVLLAKKTVIKWQP